MLDILFADEHLVAVNKPHGLLVHRSSIAADAEEFALQILRDQLNRHVYPTHRLDRKTGGVLLFALDKTTETAMQQQFMNNAVRKSYLTILRGFAPISGEINYPLKKENGTLQDAFTAYTTLAQTELPVAFGKHPTSRYSLVMAKPTTGRMHQLRKHFSHIFHPIIGDRTHGCNKQNKFFTDNWDMNTMLLHALQLSFIHPISQQPVTISASIQPEFDRMINLMNWQQVYIQLLNGIVQSNTYEATS
ncbi:pseudouridine synthase [Mucilaginibacter lacusdianchii]|uniref:pseudouridine synthase n=1 Tax=Mucilaginibacter lacusdianchii TaxID=2684211 RepID=UPI00131C43CE|nr:pseudouridine synthase [Mucilaginibacter sp. JXJ CY 39]